MSYAPLDDFIAPARPRSEIWRTFVGFLVALGHYAGGAWDIIVGGGLLLSGIMSPGDLAAGETPPAVLLVLFHFLAMAAAVLIATRVIHRRPALSLLGDRHRLWRDFLSMAGVLLVFEALGAIISVFIGDLTGRMPFRSWLLFLPLALPLVLLQTGAEELVFRGYLMQQLGARFGAGARVAWMIVPALLFTVAHADLGNQGSNLWAVMAVIMLFAIISADVTARTGSIGAAWGVQFVNYVQALLIISVLGPLSGLSLGTLGVTAASPEVLPLFAADALGLILIYVVWRRLYG